MSTDSTRSHPGGQTTTGWRWRNVPVPEPHVAGLLLGLGLHRLRPWHVGRDTRPARALGLSFLVVGVAVVAWAVRAVGDADVTEPSRLVTAGPYARSRNPMYVGWTILYVGVSLLLATVWPLLLLPVVAVAGHRAVRREERELERAFGDEYGDYRRGVRRYL